MNTTTRTIPTAVKNSVALHAANIKEGAYVIAENVRVYGERSQHHTWAIEAERQGITHAQRAIAGAVSLAASKGCADEMAAFIASLEIPTISGL